MTIPFRVSLSAILLLALLGQTPALASPLLSRVPTANNWLVDSFLDEADVTPGVGGCATLSGSCTLRAAIMEANASASGGDTISLPAGTYTLTVAPVLTPTDTTGANGDLDIIKNLTLNRSTPGQVIIDGNNIDRVFEVSATVTINQATIRKGGGTGFFGIWVQPGADLTLNEVAVTNNNGAGIRADSASLMLNRVAVLNNGGSGLLITGSSNVNVDNTTISSNGSSGPNGGGIDVSGGVLLLNNATIANNLGLVSGGLYRSGSATVLMQNSIVAGNTAPDCSGTLSSVAYSLIQNVAGCTIGGSGSGNLFGINPGLGALQNNGGPTPTHALGLASLAVNAGDPTDCKDSQPVSLVTDQRGTTRPQPQGGRCDMGAYEVPAVQFASTNFSANEGVGVGAVTAKIDGVSALTVTVSYTASNSTAVAGSDYVTTTGTLTFPPNTLAMTFTVPLIEDLLDEANETVALTLGNPNGALLDTPLTATLTIIDNDLPPEYYLTSEEYNVNENAGPATITVNLDAVSGLTVTMNYTTTNDTALAGSDYIATSGTLTFAPGLTSAAFNVPIINETIYEADESLRVNLGNASNALPGLPADATLTILNDDPPQLFLPLIRSNVFTCWGGLSEIEPNGSAAQANGPLCFDGRPYTGGFNPGAPPNNHDWDYYTLQWSQAGQFTVRLTGTALGAGLQVQMYYQTINWPSTLVGFSASSPYQIPCPPGDGDCTGAAGLYYILVFMPANYSGSGYTLTVTAPLGP